MSSVSIFGVLGLRESGRAEGERRKIASVRWMGARLEALVSTLFLVLSSKHVPNFEA